MPDFLDVCLEAAQRGGAESARLASPFQSSRKRAQGLGDRGRRGRPGGDSRGHLVKPFQTTTFWAKKKPPIARPRASPPFRRGGRDFRWIVDPLDGTTNYVHRLPGYAVSIALQQGNELVLGVVFDPVSEECFAAKRGEGATLNG